MMEITFQGGSVQSGGWTHFNAQLDGKRVVNRIEEEALQDRFGSDGTDEGNERAFAENLAAIRARAEQKIRRGELNDMGGADLIPDDFPDLRRA